MLRCDKGPVVGVDEGNHLVAQIGVVATGPRRVYELRSAIRGPGIDPDNDARWNGTAGEEVVRRLGKRLAVGRPVVPHSQVTGVALNYIDRRPTFTRVGIVARGNINP
jgi:hypothetical protein